jgi:hypothetical protein
MKLSTQSQYQVALCTSAECSTLSAALHATVPLLSTLMAHSSPGTPTQMQLSTQSQYQVALCTSAENSPLSVVKYVADLLLSTTPLVQSFPCNYRQPRLQLLLQQRLTARFLWR